MKKQKADEVITKYLKRIYGFAMKKSFSFDEAEELCADIISEIYPSLLRTDEIYNMDGYIWRISEHVYSKYVSAKKRRQGVSIDGIEIASMDDYNFGEAEEEMKRLRREIAFLTENRREIVFSYYYENKTIPAIAAEAKVPVGTVKWHLSKARNDLKEGFTMEREIGKLGMKPIQAIDFAHYGNPGMNTGPVYYMGDSLNLNIVYSVYHNAKTRSQIAEELGVTPVYIDDRIKVLENNGFLVSKAGGKYTTYVLFNPETYSLEQEETYQKKQLQAARLLADEYAPAVRASLSAMKEVYVPGGNREVFEAAMIFYAVLNRCGFPVKKDLSQYSIKTMAGGDFIAGVAIPSTQSDTSYVPTLQLPSYEACGSMARWSDKYPVYSWSVDTRYCSREGGWENNLTSDYEYIYELITGAIADNSASADKFDRLRARRFITDEGKVNITVVKGSSEEVFAKIPPLDDKYKKQFAGFALEMAEAKAKSYPPQMRDLIISWGAGSFIDTTVGLMVQDILYEKGVFKALTENEKTTADLLMFSDVLP